MVCHSTRQLSDELLSEYNFTGRRNRASGFHVQDAILHVFVLQERRVLSQHAPCWRHTLSMWHPSHQEPSIPMLTAEIEHIGVSVALIEWFYRTCTQDYCSIPM